jgi:hypothetical protein
MKGKPSDYLSDDGDGHRRFLKPGDVPAPGGSFVITEIEPIEQLNRFTGKPERLIRLGLDSDWLFDLRGRNLKTTIQLLGDSFDGWLNKRLNFVVSSFTKDDGSEQVYLRVIRLDLSSAVARTRARLEAEKQPKKSGLE